MISFSSKCFATSSCNLPCVPAQRQAEPLQTASLAAMAAFAFVLSVVTLHRRGARLSSDGARHPGLDFDALDDEETLLLHAGK